MAGVQDQFKIKFRLFDGSDIGPKTFLVATSVATLDESILAQWPKDIIHCTKNCCNPFPREKRMVQRLSNARVHSLISLVGITAMHVVIQPPSLDKDKKLVKQPKQSKCVCVIL